VLKEKGMKKITRLTGNLTSIQKRLQTRVTQSLSMFQIKDARSLESRCNCKALGIDDKFMHRFSMKA
jgi:hypothetical protein